MKFTAARETLLKPLQAVIGVVERRQTMPILSNVLLVAKGGLVDGDIYGPSLPTLLGLDDLEATVNADKMFVPFEVHGIKAAAGDDYG